uniref:Skeletal acidic protein 1 n=1 Tax=Acropora digitifera TaxID=70779 RepID=A0A1V0CMI1_ACRDI|nr:skeletal acidic protein 1 [Acropora digitifera]
MARDLLLVVFFACLLQSFWGLPLPLKNENAIVDGDGTSVVTTKEDASTIFERDPNPANQVSALVTGVILDENGDPGESDESVDNDGEGGDKDDDKNGDDSDLDNKEHEEEKGDDDSGDDEEEDDAEGDNDSNDNEGDQ